MERKLDFSLHEVWGLNDDDPCRLQFNNLYFLANGVAHDFHAGKDFVSWSDAESVFGYGYEGDIQVRQSIDGIPDETDPVFAMLNIDRFKFDIQRPKKSSTPRQKPAQISSNNWKKVECSRFRTKKLPNGKWEISYTE